MDQLAIGKFIAKKRKNKNLTQEQLAEQLGVSNKTVSKWETGKCMPDYSVVTKLCDTLKITVSELMDGEEDKDSIRVYDNEQILELLRRTQELEKQKNILSGIILIVMGIALMALSQNLGGTDVKDFFAGLLLGLACGEMAAGVFVTARGLAKR
ncbi:MAG: XRE family transcriptional regulator [Clostridia bacterium]|jgi:transcriptional regulator with XRE-family HTH domain|nr:helix-turn-helix transcriptional regulator [Lachnospiraceae bacterium]NCC01327.1 XRE family transcriptional regulator [Clostridia bacterium]NCD03189.1 XRE family transcriptional regulator [Clostridia bacterium]